MILKIRYVQIMGTATRSGRAMSAQDGMIALAHQPLAIRNDSDFVITELPIINPWGDDKTHLFCRVAFRQDLCAFDRQTRKTACEFI